MTRQTAVSPTARARLTWEVTVHTSAIRSQVLIDRLAAGAPILPSLRASDAARVARCTCSRPIRVGPILAPTSPIALLVHDCGVLAGGAVCGLPTCTLLTKLRTLEALRDRERL